VAGAYVASCLTLLVGCGRPAEAAPVQARGLIVDVVSTSITELRSVDVRTDAGDTLRFSVQGDVGITPGHAREHMVRGEPVTVTYRPVGAELIASLIED
jgi:hypothetical protein